MGETNFHAQEFPRSGTKAKDGGGKKERERERKLVITMAKLRMAHASRLGQKKKKREKRLNDDNNNDQAMHGARKPPGPK